MSGVFLVTVTGGPGTTPTNAFRYPDVVMATPSDQWSALYIDTARRKNGSKAKTGQQKALIVHRSSTLSGAGIDRRLASAATPDLLIQLLQADAPSNPERNFVNSYLTNAELQPVRVTSWWFVLTDLLFQVNPKGETWQETADDLEQVIRKVG